MTGDDQDGPADRAARTPWSAGLTLDSPLEEVLAALKAADPSAHALAERGAWDLVESRGPLGKWAYAWAVFHRQLRVQCRTGEQLEVDATIRARVLEPELEGAYVDRLAAACEHDGDMRAVQVEATSQVPRKPQLRLVTGPGPIPATAGVVDFTVERQELMRALLAVKAVLEDDEGRFGKVHLRCSDTMTLRFGVSGDERSQSVFELRLPASRCARVGELAVQAHELHGALRTLASGPVGATKAEGHSALKLRQRGVETSMPTVDYVPFASEAEELTPAGEVALDQLRDMLTAVVHVAQTAEARAMQQAVVRFGFEDGRLHLVAADGHRLVRAVGAVPGGEALAGATLAVIDADRLRRMLDAYCMYLLPRVDRSPARMRLSLRPGHSLSGESGAVRFTLPHDASVLLDYRAMLPERCPDVVVVGYSELRAHLYRMRRPFGDAPTEMRIESRVDGARLQETDLRDGRVTERALDDAVVYGRPFVRHVRASSLLDLLEHLPSASHHAFACDSEDDECPLIVIPWPGFDSQTTATRVLDFVAFGLDVATLAIIMPVRSGRS